MAGAGIGRSSGGLNAADRAKLALVPADTASALAAKADKAGGTIVGLTKLGVRDTSAAFDHVIKSTSSVPLDAERTTTLDAQNQSLTLPVPSLKALTDAYAAGWRPMQRIEEWAPAIDTQVHDFSITPSEWEELELRLFDLKVVAGSGAAYLRIDGAIPNQQFTYQDYSSVHSAVRTIFMWNSDVNGAARATLKCLSPVWLYDFESGPYTGTGAMNGITTLVPPTASVGVSGSAAGVFAGGASRVELWGRRKP